MDLAEDGTRQNIEYLKSRIMDFDMVLILGDLSYKFGDALDEIEEALEPVAAIRPVMVLPGNHEYDPEEGLGFHHFNTRWHMPENGQLNQWYSWNMGNLHFVAISTEDSLQPNSRQGRWLMHDLKMASMRQDYVIMLGHKTPIGSADKKWLNRKAHKLWNDLQLYLPAFQVRLSLWGHIHLYERTHPIGGTVFVTIGVGGARLDTQVKEPQPEWSAYRHAEVGACFFTFDHIVQELHMQYCAAHTNEVLDRVSLSTAPHEESSLPRNHSTDVFPILPLTEPPSNGDEDEDAKAAAPKAKKKKKEEMSEEELRERQEKKEKELLPKLNAAGEHITSNLKSPISNKANEPHASNTGNPANAPQSASANPPSIAPIPVPTPGPLATTASQIYHGPLNADAPPPEDAPGTAKVLSDPSSSSDDTATDSSTMSPPTPKADLVEVVQAPLKPLRPQQDTEEVRSFRLPPSRLSSDELSDPSPSDSAPIDPSSSLTSPTISTALSETAIDPKTDPNVNSNKNFAPSSVQGIDEESNDAATDLSMTSHSNNTTTSTPRVKSN